MTAGIYVHLPFCRAICPYCDFAVTTGSAYRRERFVDLLLAEIDIVARGDDVGDIAGVTSRVGTIYLGGGTPSALSDAQIAAIVEALRRRFPVTADTRITMEANPEDVTAQRAATWRDLGVATLSLGVQSLDGAALRFLGRRHTADTAAAAVEAARGAGFATVSFDLIFGLPGQEARDWEREVDAAVRLRPDHLSCYQLTIHEKTPFGARRRAGDLEELADERHLELFLSAHDALTALGYEHYEVSNYANGAHHRSRHNLGYWSHAPYLGLGPSAHSYDGDRARWWNLADMDAYRQALVTGSRPIASAERLDDDALLLERVMLGLRTVAGVDLDELERSFGFDLQTENAAFLESAVARRLVRIEGRRLVPEARGMALADHLARELDMSRKRD